MSRWKLAVLGGGAMLALSGATMLFGAAAASGQAGASMTISPPSQNIDAGTEEINIEIKANNVTNLGAYEFSLWFDPAIVEYVGSGDVGFLTTTGRTQQCLGFGQGASSVNQYAVIKAGCSTNGIVENDQGTQGPNGNGTLAQVVFKAKAIGTSNLLFKGLEGSEAYYIGAPDTSLPAGAVEKANTQLSLVEVYSGGQGQAVTLPMSPGTGIIAVIDPNAPDPTALPNTPTPEAPDDVDEDDFQATVAAAVGTPRVLPTAGPGGTTPNTGENPTGTTSGQTGTGGAGGVGGSSSGGGLSASGGGELPEGVTVGPDGIPRGPDGVPIAGYGPQQQEPNQAWIWSGVALLLAGLATMFWGATLRRAVRNET